MNNPNSFENIHTQTLTDKGYYLVREDWPDQPYDSVTHFDYIFVTPLKIFKRNTWQDSKKEAETRPDKTLSKQNESLKVASDTK